MLRAFIICKNLFKFYKLEKKRIPGRSKNLRLELSTSIKTLSSAENERDALRREHDQINEEKKESTEECELKPDVRKPRNPVSETGRVLPQSTLAREAFRVQQALSNTENEMRLNSLKQDNNIIDDNLKLQE